MLIQLSPDKIVSEAAVPLHAAVQVNHFGVMQVHNPNDTMAKQGVAFTHECLIFEVYHPQQAKKALEQNLSVPTTLPCRIPIYEEGGRTMRALFKTPQLKGVAQDVEATIVKNHE